MGFLTPGYLFYRNPRPIIFPPNGFRRVFQGVLLTLVASLLDKVGPRIIYRTLLVIEEQSLGF